MNSWLASLVKEAVGSDCDEMCRPHGGTFSYALLPLSGEGDHLDLRQFLVVDLLLVILSVM
jgi:hypothetical protein